MAWEPLEKHVRMDRMTSSTLDTLLQSRHHCTMSLAMLVGGAECGPSNPLQSLSKRFDQDRGVQQVRTGSLWGIQGVN